jgi:hypothetical protein
MDWQFSRSNICPLQEDEEEQEDNDLFPNRIGEQP